MANESMKKENLQLGYEQCVNAYQNQTERFKSADEKMNMLLVFNAAYIAVLFAIFPLGDFALGRLIAFWIVFGLFTGCVITSIILIIIGIFPRKVKVMEIKDFKNDDVYKQDVEKFYKMQIDNFSNIVDDISNKIERKNKFNKWAMGFTIASVICIFALLVIEFI